MKTKCRKSVTALSTAGLLAIALSANAGDLYRIASDFAKFDGTEFSTSVRGLGVPPASGGVVIYSKAVIVPPNTTSLYLTVSTTGDTHQGAAHWFACTIDGVSCRVSPPGSVDGAPSGWVSLLKLPVATGGASNCNDGGGGAGDCHDNNVYYTWCVRTAPSNLTAIRTLRVKMATSVTGATVFAEKAHFYVDANVGPVGECAQAPLPTAPRGPSSVVEPDTNQR